MKLFDGIVSNKKEYSNNKGSVMLTVLISFMFIAILVAIIMPLVALNYRMKAVERRTKDEFYYVEKSLNDVYSGVGKECAQELGRAYSNTLANSYSYMEEKLAYEKFCNEYVSCLVGKFYGTDGLRVNLKDKLNGYLTDNAKSHALVNNNVSEEDANTYIKVRFVDLKGHSTYSPLSIDYKNYKKIIIEDVYVSTVAGSEYTSSITSNIEIEIPEISFFKINENELDYAIVACKGIYFNGSGDVTGNIYGGTESDGSSVTGGINVAQNGSLPTTVVFKSNYVVSGGDITVNGGTFTVKNVNDTKEYAEGEVREVWEDNEIWVENIILGSKDDSVDKESRLSVTGSTYALNDLQVEGKKKTVSMAGNYYGYGDGTNSSLEPKEAINNSALSDAYYDTDDRSKSSSIIVNATDSSIELGGLKNIVILGQAYIDHNSKYKGAATTPKVDNTTTKISEDGTGLAGTMKASQEILLVPEEFLDLSNPTKITSAYTDFGVKRAELTSWINANFSDVKLNASAPTKTVKFSRNGSTYAYCYLQFEEPAGDEEKYRNAYISSILNANLSGAESSSVEPTLQTLKRRIIMAADSQKSSIIVDDSAKVFAKNSGIISYTYENDRVSSLADANSIKIVNNVSDIAGYVGSVGNLSGKYKDLTTFLDLDSDFSKNTVAADYTNADLPFGRLWWKNGIDTDAGSGTKTSDFGGCRVVIQGTGTLNLGNALSGAATDGNGYTKALVIADGDVIVDSAVKMKGFIFCNGKLTVTDGNSLNVVSDLSVIQERISEEISEVRKEIPADMSESDTAAIDAAYKKGYLIRYLLKTDYNDDHSLKNYYDKNRNDVIGKRRYNITSSVQSDNNMNVNSDYTSFVTITKWRKTGAGTGGL